MLVNRDRRGARERVGQRPRPRVAVKPYRILVRTPAAATTTFFPKFTETLWLLARQSVRIGNRRVWEIAMKPLNQGPFRQQVLEAAKRLQGRLIRYTSRFFAGDQSRACDVVQHAFLQLCRVPDDSRPDNIDAWLFRVCRNRAIDVQRKDERLQTGQLQHVGQPLDGRPTSEETIDQHELWMLIQDCMATLPQPQREAIELWSNGFRYAQIAEIMDKVESSVRVMVHRAITKMRNDAAIRRWIADDEINPAAPVPPRVQMQTDNRIQKVER